MNRLKETGIFIPTYNAMSYDSFPELIKLILTVKNDLGKILIIDSSSNDNTVDFVTKLGINIRVIPKQDFDHGATRDMGVKILSEEYFLKYVIFLTQDSLLDSQDSLYSIIKPFDDNFIGAICGRQIPNDNANPIAEHSRLFYYHVISRVNTKSNIPEMGLRTAFMSNSFAAYNISILKAINGFPKNLIFGEDMYVSAKMILEGYKTFYCADAIVKHSHNYSIIEEFSRYFDIGVFHSSCPFLLHEFSSPNKSGLRYLISELKFTLKKHSLFWFFNSLLRSFLKLFAYNIGKQHLKIYKKLNKVISMNKNYWD